MNRKIDISDFWEANYYNHPLLTGDMVKAAMQVLQVRLPTLLLELLAIQNGGYTRGFAFPMREKTSWAKDHVPLLELFGIITGSAVSSPQNMLESRRMSAACGLPGKQIILAGYEHWWITLDYRRKHEPSVRWIDVQAGEDIFIAGSFEEFIEGLVPEGEFVVE